MFSRITCLDFRFSSPFTFSSILVNKIVHAHKLVICGTPDIRHLSWFRHPLDDERESIRFKRDLGLCSRTRHCRTRGAGPIAFGGKFTLNPPDVKERLGGQIYPGQGGKRAINWWERGQ